MDSHPPIIAVLTDRYFQYQAEIVETISSELNTLGYGVLCVTAKELLNRTSTNRAYAVCNSIYPEINHFSVRGLIAISGSIGHGVDADTLAQFLSSYAIPKVSLGMNLPDIASVYFEEYQGMSDLMHHLLNCGTHKRFAFIRGHHNDPFSNGREKIFCEALRSRGYADQDIFFLEGDFNPFTTYQVVTELLNNNEHIDCIVAANDAMAASAARAAKAYGLTIPTDIAISGYDDSHEATQHSPAITTIRQSAKNMAHDGVTLLLRQLEQQIVSGHSKSTKTELAAVNSISTQSELIVRRSTNPIDAELDLSDSLDEPKLRHLLDSAMYGLDMPEHLTMQKISEPLWQTLKYGSVDLITIVTGLSEAIVLQNAHWWLNLCDQMQSINDRLLEGNFDKAHIALIGSAISKIKERIWSLEIDTKFEASRLQNARTSMQLAMSSCNDIEDILSTMDSWLEDMNPKRCFLIGYRNAGSTPDSTAHLLHAFKNGQPITTSNKSFESNRLLPENMVNELADGLLVFSPVYADNMLFGYLLIDPSGIKLLYIDAAAQCIGNAMRTHHHIEALQSQKDSLQSVNAELARLANYDALTGLANRLQFQQHLKNCTKESDNTDSPFSLLFMDLDGFKLINDTLGHSIGDQLLNQVAQRLIDCLSDSSYFDGFISRLGGDEFTVILHQINESASVEKMGQQLLKLLSRPYLLNGNEVSISASIGCAAYPENAADAESLVIHADIAMYRAKNNGKNSIAYFNPNMISANVQELTLAQDLRHALVNNELCMYYQPRVDLNTGKICAVEALMRWFVPNIEGIVVQAHPDEFIALAEKIGVISQLDTYALHYSCKQAATWAENGMPLKVSVNVSVNQLQQDDFVETVISAIEQHKLDHSLLELEITESAAMTDVESNIAKLSKLKAAGIEISIDDFGTGYSSLNYLKRLPVDNLKIDRSFIMDIVDADGGNSADAAIVRSVVALGKSMEFGLIAEGIENKAQHDFACSLECDQAQGYLYAQPLAEEDMTAMLKADADYRVLDQHNDSIELNKNKAA